jgi:FlaA1/EpsC-like NDP-sugar epimerase
MRTARISFVLFTAAALAASLWLGYQVRFNFAVPADTAHAFLPVFTGVIGLKLFCLWRFGQLDALLDYFSLPDFSRLFWILIIPSLVVYGVSTQFGSAYAPPRGVVVADFSFSVLALASIRRAFDQVMRASDAPRPAAGGPRQRARRAGIVGAGLVGTALAQEFATRRELGLQAVAFFDDDRIKWGKQVHNIPVLGAPEILLDDKLNLELEEVIIAMPSAPAGRVAEIVKTLQRLRIKFSTVPSIYELTTGQAKVSQLRSVDVQDLLGREQVRLATEDIRHLLRGRVVMVTGAGGSIGSELCRQIASYSPRSLLLVEQSEVQLFQIEQELIDTGWGDRLVPLAANIQDELRLEHIFQQYRPDAVFHAAAHKHVPLMESQPGEAVKNNALGTLRLAETCLRHHTERFVLVSTDKAINPTSVMGASKRLAEMCLQSLHATSPAGTRFMAVRFGNVLGSSGSVVPIFNKQIAAGGPVKVTHPDMRRYFMTIPEAVGLVLQTAALGSGGEIFLLDMGKPVKIVDLARHLIQLSGFVPDQDIRIEFTGLRPGEKLFEELSYAGEKITATRHPKIMRLLGEPPPCGQVRAFLLSLAAQADQLGPDEIKTLLKRAVPEYQPQLKPAVNDAPHPVEAPARVNGHRLNGFQPALAAGVEDAFRQVARADVAG